MKHKQVRLHPKKINYVVAGLFTVGVVATTQAQENNVQALQEVVVTASGFDQSIREAPASISVITHQDLEEKPFKDLADALGCPVSTR